jgi:putative transposase
LLKGAIDEERCRRPFTLDAIVLLPDHIHMLLTLPAGDTDYSSRIGQIKKRFTRAFLATGGQEGVSTSSRRRQRCRGVWEKRFWEHTIADRRDFMMHLDYIHINPVKHGLVQWPADWPWSSFHRYLKEGWYEPNWCGHVNIKGVRYLEPD